MDRRLVVRLFSQTLNCARHHGSDGRAEPAAYKGCARHSVTATPSIRMRIISIIYLERSANKWPVLPENFSFLVVRGRQNRPFTGCGMTSSASAATIPCMTSAMQGGAPRRSIAVLGGYWKGKVRAEHADKKLMTVMKLFVGTIGFTVHAAGTSRVWRKMSRAGRVETEARALRADYYLNPRRCGEAET